MTGGIIRLAKLMPQIPRRTVQVKEVAQNTYLLDAGIPPGRSAPEVAYLLVGDVLALIEPGSTITASSLLSKVSELGFSLEDVAYLIPTHVHIDHGGGAGYLAQHLPQAKVVVHPRGARHMIDPSRLIQASRVVFGEDFEEAFGPILPVPENQVHVTEEGEVIQVGERRLRIVFTPGHATHHISIQDDLTGGIFCGEALGYLHASMPDFPVPCSVPGFDLEAYLESIEKLSSLPAKVLFYSHSGVRSNVETLVKLAKENSFSFGDVIQNAFEAGKDQEGILEQLLDYLERHSHKMDDPDVFGLIIAGYVEHLKSKNAG